MISLRIHHLMKPFLSHHCVCLDLSITDGKTGSSLPSLEIFSELPMCSLSFPFAHLGSLVFHLCITSCSIKPENEQASTASTTNLTKSTFPAIRPTNCGRSWKIAWYNFWVIIPTTIEDFFFYLNSNNSPINNSIQGLHVTAAVKCIVACNAAYTSMYYFGNGYQ